MIGRNNGFKKLGDDTKKTEKKAKLYHIGLIINVVLIVAVIIIAIVVVKNPEILSRFRTSKNENVIENNEYVDKIQYLDFQVVSKDNVWYVIGKKDSNWYEIAKSTESIRIIGRYLNKLYCYSNLGLHYIDFEKENPELTDWIKYKQYKVPETDETGTLYFQKAYIIDDTIYFKYNLDIASGTQASGIQSINVKSSSFDEAEQIVSEVKSMQWGIDQDNKLIYYLNNSNELKKYNIETKQEELVLSDIRNFDTDGKIILYLRINNEYRETDEAVVQAATYELRKYDLSNMEDTLVFESSLYNVTTGTLNGFAQIYNNDIYYKNENQIIKYNNGANEVAYTYADGTLKTFKYREDGVLKIVVDDNIGKYIYHDKMYVKIPNVNMVTMKDGKTQIL